MSLKEKIAEWMIYKAAGLLDYGRMEFSDGSVFIFSDQSNVGFTTYIDGGYEITGINAASPGVVYNPLGSFPQS